MTEQPRDTPQFFLTAPSPCPYLPGRQERKVFTHLVGRRAVQLNEILTQGGFRRSQSIAYRPACEHCRACVSVRVLVRDFVETRGFRRILAANADLSARMIPAQPTAEQYGLFRRYLHRRHTDGGMADMSVLDYAAMIEDTHVETRLVEYRRPRRRPDETSELVGIALTDLLSDGLSMVYSFYDPDLSERSLGTFMILDHIRKTRASGLPHLYLGYWVEGSRKMDYKARFLPQERLGMIAWERVER
ncbi:arginyltransferase [Rhabdaerophilum calidifontis]|uniref:arginyltransferase n=1 Tax=Rhabdaerophilum calidifontis TaxID=2604328 RepID=UPI001239459A|nr:arginyltransferase [Rhabdaerophilum calidifontis]